MAAEPQDPANVQGRFNDLNLKIDHNTALVDALSTATGSIFLEVWNAMPPKFLGNKLASELPLVGFVLGTTAIMTDGAAAPVLGGAATGGGTLKTPVMFDGTGWING